MNIDKICKKYNIKNYTINEDGSIDVNGSVYLAMRDLKRLPLKFRNVTGSFECSNNKLTSLEGCPISAGYFNCSNNKLTSLEGCASSVRFFNCSDNKLTNLEGCPKNISGSFDCHNNNLISLLGCPEKIGGYFYCSSNNLTSLEGCPSVVGYEFCCSNNNLPYDNYKGFTKGEIIADVKRISREKKLQALLG